MIRQTMNLLDRPRGRRVPVAVYDCPDPRGTLIFSVGFGGSCEGYSYLALGWRARGFRVIVVEHVGSNLEVMQQLIERGQRRAQLAERVRERVKDVTEMAHRPQDLGYVARELVPVDQPVGLGGHSFGSYTVLAASGAQTVWPGNGARTRWKFEQLFGRPVELLLGLVAMSPQPPESMISQEGYASVGVPCLMMTGSEDFGMPAGVSVADRFRAFDALPPARRLLAYLEQADHMTFAAVGLNAGRFLPTIEAVTGEYWEALGGSVRNWAAMLTGSKAWPTAVEWKR
jgi:predicted dienelactone hydrolase